MTKAFKTAAAAYLLVVVLAAIVFASTENNSPAAYITLWILCLPTSLVAGPIYLAAASLGEELVGTSPAKVIGVVFNVVWFASLAIAQIFIAYGIIRSKGKWWTNARKSQ